MKIKPLSPLLEYTKTSPYDTLHKAAKAMCKHKSAQGNIGLQFSMFESNVAASEGGNAHNEGDWIVDHPDIWSDEPVFEGVCVFFSDYWRISDDKVYGEVMVSPTWRDIIVEANRQLIDDSDGSTACLFFEGFRDGGLTSDGIRQIELVWGS